MVHMMAGAYQPVNLTEECGFGLAGYCCSICQTGPCRINPFNREKAGTACGFSQRQVAVAHLLCYLLVEAGEYGSFIPENQDQEAVSGIDGHVLSVLGWIGLGGQAGVEKGINLLIGLSLALLSRRAGNGAANDRSPEGPCPGGSVYLLEMNGGPGEGSGPGPGGDAEPEAARASLGRLLSISAEKGPETPGNTVVIVPGGRKSRNLSTIIGLAARGFTVRSALPYPLVADRKLLDLLESLLAGRVEDMPESGPGKEC